MKTYLKENKAAAKLAGNKIISQSIFESIYEGVHEEAHIYTEPLQEKIDELAFGACEKVRELLKNVRQPLWTLKMEFEAQILNVEMPLRDVINEIYDVVDRVSDDVEDKLRVYFNFNFNFNFNFYFYSNFNFYFYFYFYFNFYSNFNFYFYFYFYFYSNFFIRVR
jgi:hypothetical protein